MSKPALVIIYNHQFNRNIQPIEDLYRNRFSKIFHLVPFYEGNRPNVIPVYENSFYFQGYVSQAWSELKSAGAGHYIFVGDDLILNPMINEENYRTELAVDEETSFIPMLIEFHRMSTYWPRCREAVEWDPLTRGVEIENLLPSAESAMGHYRRHGLAPSGMKAFLTDPKLNRESAKGQETIPLKYPLIGSYSDIFAVAARTMDKFVSYCGMFAAANLFVEVALPSALAMAAPKISTEANTKLKGRPLWTAEDHKILDKYSFELGRLLEAFPSGHLYIHPIKLSKWK